MAEMKPRMVDGEPVCDGTTCRGIGEECCGMDGDPCWPWYRMRVDDLSDLVDELKKPQPEGVPAIFRDRRLYDYEKERYEPHRREEMTLSGQLWGVIVNGPHIELYMEDDASWFLVATFHQGWVDDLRRLLSQTQAQLSGAITMETIKHVREETGGSIGDCKQALLNNAGDADEAIAELRKRGQA